MVRSEEYLSAKSHSEWLKIATQIIDGKDVVCPICNKQTIEHLYAGNDQTRIGFLRVWCVNCMKGIHISRVRIPENEIIIDFNKADNIPFFKEITP